MTIATTRERLDAIREALATEWPKSRKYASVQDVLSIAGKLWNLTYVMRAGKYFVWHLLRLTGLHDKASRQTREKRQVRLGWEFHGDLEFWRWALEVKLAEKGESLSAFFFNHVQRTPFRHYLSDASFDAVGGHCPEIKVFWRYQFQPEFTAELKRKAEEKEKSAITINTLELLGMIVTCWVVQTVVGEKPTLPGQAILMRGDNVSAVSWVNRCGGSRDRRAGLLMRLLGRMEIENKWCHVAKHIPGRENTLADGISRWKADEVESNVKRLTRDDSWRMQDIGDAGRELIEMILQENLPNGRLDDIAWNLMITQ